MGPLNLAFAEYLFLRVYLLFGSLLQVSFIKTIFLSSKIGKSFSCFLCWLVEEEKNVLPRNGLVIGGWIERVKSFAPTNY